MRFLMGKEELEGLRTDFVDSWLAVNEEPTPRSNVTKEQDEMLTFPSDAPSKRIDFVFVVPYNRECVVDNSFATLIHHSIKHSVLMWDDCDGYVNPS